MMFHSFLLVDAGNTRVKWAVAELSGALSSQDFHPKNSPAVKGELATPKVTPEFIRKLKADFPGHYLILSSVVPTLTLLFSRIFKRGFHSVTSESPLGFGFDYPKPVELGADRIAAAEAVCANGTYPAIIVSCGTATAFSVLNAKGRFCGGAIAPGLQTQLTSLLGATAQLPDIDLKPPRSALAKSTQEAIRAGVMFNFQGGAKEIIRQLSNALPGRSKPAIILTGGDARHLAESLMLPHTLRPLLVFEGLRIIGNRVWQAREG